MRNLNQFEIHNVAAAAILPSTWMVSGATGAVLGMVCSTVTSFSRYPVPYVTAIAYGTGLGIGFHALYDILHEYDF